MISRASFFLWGTLWMMYLSQGRADSLPTQDIGNMGNGDFKLTNFYDATATREPCQICSKGANCSFVETVFTRKRMEEGYNFLATIPSGACNVTVRENLKTENNLALRWTLDKHHYFNGGWMIQQSGNYMAGSNLFTYKHSETFGNNSKSGEYIHFASQLNHWIDVLLIVKEKNPGIKFSYVLPPIKNSQDRQTEEHATKAEKDHVTEELKPSHDITTSKNTAEEVILQKKDNQKKQMAVISNLPNFISRQAGADAHKTETARLIRSLKDKDKSHDTTLGELESYAKTNENSIKALKTNVESHRACKTGYTGWLYENTATVTCRIEYKYAYSGHDYAVLYLSTGNAGVTQCKQKCIEMYPQCVGFTVDKKRGKCFRKSKMASREYYPQDDSGHCEATNDNSKTVKIDFGHTFPKKPSVTIMTTPELIDIEKKAGERKWPGEPYYEARAESITTSSFNLKMQLRNVNPIRLQWMACV